MFARAAKRQQTEGVAGASEVPFTGVWLKAATGAQAELDVGDLDG